jgi:hypothetical protein
MPVILGPNNETVTQAAYDALAVDLDIERKLHAAASDQIASLAAENMILNNGFNDAVYRMEQAEERLAEIRRQLYYPGLPDAWVLTMRRIIDDPRATDSASVRHE